MKQKIKKITKFNFFLLLSILFYVFIIALLPLGAYRPETYSLIFTIIYLLSGKIVSIKGHKRIFVYAGITIATMWLSGWFHFKLLTLLSAFLSIFFIVYIIFIMLSRVAKSKTVSMLEFVEAINVYFLMGIIGAILFRIVYDFVPGASFNLPGDKIIAHIDFIYFSFVTLTTLGYGDITPIDPFAKSLAVFLSISGQLYLTMIIAVLVGKYLSKKQNS